MFISFDGNEFNTLRERNKYEEDCIQELRDIYKRYSNLRSMLSCGDLCFYGGIVQSEDGSIETDLTDDITYPFNIDDMLGKVDEFLEQIDGKILEIKGE